MTFVPLHNHSDYSLLDGASQLPLMVARAKELGFPALALTDHDNLCGSMEFSHVAKRLDIKPIIGVEISLEGNQHITLLSKNIEGYRNISRLLSHSQMESKSGRLDNEQLFKYKDGLIALSDCRENGLNIDIQNHNQQKINNILTNYMDAFGKENFFVELHQNLVKGDVQRNKILSEHARYLGLDTVATNNVHYHVQERSKLQDVLVAIKNKLKAEKLYNEIERNPLFVSPIAKEDRSIMNVPFIFSNGEDEEEFLSFCHDRGLRTLKGHRSVGGFRASIYNAMPEAGVDALIQAMKDYESR